MEDIFSVESVNFIVGDYLHIKAKSVKFGMSMMLDIDADVYTIEKGEKFKMKLTPTLNTADGSADCRYYNASKQWTIDAFKYISTIAGDYEHIMHGQLHKFRFREEGSGKNALTEMVMFLDRGGDIMSLKGSREQMTSFQLYHRYFLCIKKV